MEDATCVWSVGKGCRAAAAAAAAAPASPRPPGCPAKKKAACLEDAACVWSVGKGCRAAAAAATPASPPPSGCHSAPTATRCRRMKGCSWDPEARACVDDVDLHAAHRQDLEEKRRSAAARQKAWLPVAEHLLAAAEKKLREPHSFLAFLDMQGNTLGEEETERAAAALAPRLQKRAQRHRSLFGAQPNVIAAIARKASTTTAFFVAAAASSEGSSANTVDAANASIEAALDDFGRRETRAAALKTLRRQEKYFPTDEAYEAYLRRLASQTPLPSTADPPAARSETRRPSDEVRRALEEAAANAMTRDGLTTPPTPDRTELWRRLASEIEGSRDALGPGGFAELLRHLGFGGNEVGKEETIRVKASLRSRDSPPDEATLEALSEAVASVAMRASWSARSWSQLLENAQAILRNAAAAPRKEAPVGAESKSSPRRTASPPLSDGAAKALEPFQGASIDALAGPGEADQRILAWLRCAFPEKGLGNFVRLEQLLHNTLALKSELPGLLGASDEARRRRLTAVIGHLERWTRRAQGAALAAPISATPFLVWRQYDATSCGPCALNNATQRQIALRRVVADRDKWKTRTFEEFLSRPSLHARDLRIESRQTHRTPRPELDGVEEVLSSAESAPNRRGRVVVKAGPARVESPASGDEEDEPLRNPEAPLFQHFALPMAYVPGHWPRDLPPDRLDGLICNVYGDHWIALRRHDGAWWQIDSNDLVDPEPVDVLRILAELRRDDRNFLIGIGPPEDDPGRLLTGTDRRRFFGLEERRPPRQRPAPASTTQSEH